MRKIIRALCADESCFIQDNKKRLNNLAARLNNINEKQPASKSNKMLKATPNRTPS